MKSRASIIIFCLLPVMLASANERIRGIRAYGGNDETQLPIVLLKEKSISGGLYASTGDSYVTVEFDMIASIDPQLKLIVVHCSRDWQEDWSLFDDNFMNLQATDVRATQAPAIIRGYGYHYAIHCPDPALRLNIEYSGNYKMKIIEGEDTLGEARFYAVDPFATVTVQTFNDVDNALPSQPQVHTVQVNAGFAPEVFPSSLEGVDLIIDHRTYSPIRIDPGDTSGNVLVDDSGPLMRFIHNNIFPGNAYRQINLRDSRIFPPSSSPIAIVPSDLVRTGLIDSGDRHGSAILNRVNPYNAEYLPIKFRLDAVGMTDREIYLVGPFNDWRPTLEYRMDLSQREHNYSRVVILKRGLYEYQYVTGTWDEATKQVVDQSWTELEANGWSTLKRYTALIYYRDTRYGGIDRLVGCGRNL